MAMLSGDLKRTLNLDRLRLLGPSGVRDELLMGAAARTFQVYEYESAEETSHWTRRICVKSTMRRTSGAASCAGFYSFVPTCDD